MKKLVLLLLLVSSPCYAATKYIAPVSAGAGDGSTSNDPYAWADGAGFTTAQTALSNGDTIQFLAGSYTYTGSGFTISKQLTINGAGISKYTGTYFTGNRQVPSVADTTNTNNFGTGPAFWKLALDIDNVTISNMRIDRVANMVSAQLGLNNNITISNLYGDWIREAIYIKGDTSCTTGYRCSTGSNTWTINNVDAIHVSKHGIRGDLGFHTATISNCDFDGGGIGGDDLIQIGFHYGTSGPAYDIDHTNCTVRNTRASLSTSYDNGDGYVTEATTSDITFTNCKAFDTWDGGWDLKGVLHAITNCISWTDGQRPYRVWGSCTITNSIAGYNHQGDLTQYADGSQSGIWIGGYVVASNFTNANNPYPYRFDDQQMSTLTYVSGVGSAPVVGSVITGGSSGSTARVLKVTGNGVSGTLLIYSASGAFTNPETVTGSNYLTGSADGFSATTSNNGFTIRGGLLEISNSIIALDRFHGGYSTTEADESGGTYTLTDSGGNVTWVENVSGTNPQFPNVYDLHWNGNNNNFNSALYGASKGFYINVTDPLQHTVTLQGVTVT